MATSYRLTNTSWYLTDHVQYNSAMRQYSPLPSRDVILHNLRYDPDTGIFTNRHGKQVGFLNSQGYRLVKVARHDYLAHRLAYKIMTGEDPPADIDHKIARDNNTWNAIRAASCAQNRWNAAPSKNNTSGFKGVYRSARTGKWAARIGINGTRHFLGWFQTVEEAAAAYQRAALQLQGAFVHKTVSNAKFTAEPKRLDYRMGASGIRGVQKHGNKWQAAYRHEHLGTFATKEEAAAAYQAVASVSVYQAVKVPLST